VQLAPVLDATLFSKLKVKDGKAPQRVDSYGQLAYQSLDRFFILDQPVRQPAGDLLQLLTHLRNGQFVNEDLAIWNHRVHRFFKGAERACWDFMDSRMLVLCCFDKDRVEVNQQYVRRFDRVCAIKSTFHGRHAMARKDEKAGMLKAIARTLYLTPGMMVKLAVNIVPELGLFNNARGIVRDALYGEDGYSGYVSGDMPSVALVEFEGYTGPPLMRGARSKWLPIVPVERRCDCGACTRFGLPLWVAKADTVHGVQGLTVGDSHPIQRVLIRWSLAAEKRWPGILYVAASRPENMSNLALETPIVESDLNFDRGELAVWNLQNKEVERLCANAMAYRA